MSEKNKTAEKTAEKPAAPAAPAAPVAPMKALPEFARQAQKLRLGVLRSNPENIRRSMMVKDPEGTGRGLEELAESLKTYGVQTPLDVMRDKDGKYVILAGNRRFAALSMLVENKTITDDVMVPVNVVSFEADPARQAFAVQVLSNVPRVDMDPADKAVMVKDGLEKHRMSVEEMSKLTGYNPEYVKGLAKIGGLPAEVLDLYNAARFDYNTAYRLAGSPEQIPAFLEAVKAGKVYRFNGGEGGEGEGEGEGRGPRTPQARPAPLKLTGDLASLYRSIGDLPLTEETSAAVNFVLHWVGKGADVSAFNVDKFFGHVSPRKAARAKTQAEKEAKAAKKAAEKNAEKPAEKPAKGKGSK